MADENETGELAGDEKAYFESRGEKIPQEKVEKPSEEKAETPTEAETDGLLDPDAPEPEKGKKLVPLRALTESRENEKKAKTSLQELEKRHAVLEDRWNTILQLNQQPEKATDEDPEPDKNVDIFKWSEWNARQVAGLKARLEARDQSEKAAKDEAQRDTAVWNLWGETARATTAATPDFPDAVKWMSETRTKQLAAMSAFQPQFKTQAGIDQQINMELKQIVIAAAQQGVSPAEVVYGMAKEWGYTAKPKEAAGDDGKAVEKLSKDMEAETSLSGAGGSRPGAALDAKAIADMSSDEFERWYAKHGAAGFKKLQVRGNA